MVYDIQRKSQRSKSSAMVIVDITGDLAKRCLHFIHNKDRERLIYVSSSINREIGAKDDEVYRAVINPFEVPESSVEGKSTYTNEIAEALGELLETSTHGLTVQMTALLRPAIFTVMCSDNPSLETLARMFLDKDGQNEDLLALGRQSPIPMYREFFTHDWYSSEYSLTKRSVRTKLLYFLGSPLLGHLINGKSTVNLQEALDTGKVIIINVPMGTDRFCSTVFSRLMVSYINAIMQRREAKELKDRKPCYIFLDEFQVFTSRSVYEGLALSRKWGARYVLATQTTQALDKQTRTAVMVNTGVKMVSQLDHEGKMLFAKELDVPMKTLNELQALQFMVRKFDGKHTAFKVKVPILGKQYFLSAKEQKELLEYIVYQSGIYKKIVVPPHPPVQKPVERQKPKKRKNNNPFDDNLQPRFNQ